MSLLGAAAARASLLALRKEAQGEEVAGPVRTRGLTLKSSLGPARASAPRSGGKPVPSVTSCAGDEDRTTGL